MNSPFIGFGLGLRTDHIQYVLEHKPNIDWFEIISENFLVDGGKPRYHLSAIRDRYPVVMHGVSLSIGSTDPINVDYLKKLKLLANEVEPEWISDHLCWTSLNKFNSHDLLPLPYNEEAIEHVVERVKFVQDFLGRRILLENVSSYLTYNTSDIEEWDFLNEIAVRADSRILLDINNIYVSARNHHFSEATYINAIDPSYVQQFHLAGHKDCGKYIVDTHDHDICNPVWQLYRMALKRFGTVSTLIERDDNIPAFCQLETELNTARKIAAEEMTVSTAHKMPGYVDAS